MLFVFVICEITFSFSSGWFIESVGIVSTSQYISSFLYISISDAELMCIEIGEFLTIFTSQLSGIFRVCVSFSNVDSADCVSAFDDILYTLFPTFIFPFIRPNVTMSSMFAVFVLALFFINSEMVYVPVSFSRAMVSPISTGSFSLNVISPFD